MMSKTVEVVVMVVLLAALAMYIGLVQAASYNVAVSWTPVADADLDVQVLCDVGALPATVRAQVPDSAGTVAFAIESIGNETLRCATQYQRRSTRQIGALSTEVSAQVPFPRPGPGPTPTITIGAE